MRSRDAAIERALIEGLIGEHVDAYYHSPTFRSAIRSLAAMLPAMIDGLAEEAKAGDKRLEQAHQLAHIPPTKAPKCVHGNNLYVCGCGRQEGRG